MTKAGKKRKDRKTDDGFRPTRNLIITRNVICFKPNLDDLTYEGCVAMDMKLIENIETMMINAVDLELTKVMWEEDVTQNRQEAIEIQNLDKQRVGIVFDPFLIPQQGQLRINFRGHIQEKKLAGLYKAKSKVNDDQCNLMAAFFPIEARRCFPCFDDPAWKSSFDICLIMPKGMTPIGNTIVKVQYPHKRKSELEIIEFKKTPPISTPYLGFVLGYFDYLEGVSSGDDAIPVKIYTPLGKSEQGEFALKTTCDAIAMLTKYFKVSFPAQKLDLVCITDFGSKSMELWGLIMFQESYLLLQSPENRTIAGEKSVCTAVCQAIIKQWIGCLVTMNWWSYIWLQEGLAVLLKYFCFDEIYPDFKIRSAFLNEVFQKALRVDSFKSTHALDVSLNGNSEIEEHFNVTTRKKGAVVLRMIYYYIGEANFKKAITVFINKFKYLNASSADFLKCCDDVSGERVSHNFLPWINIKGYPLVKVTSKQEGKNRLLSLTQEKFTLDPSFKNLRNDPMYSIHITILTEKSPTKSVTEVVLDGRSTKVVLNDVSKHDWIKLNSGSIGFYRVNYSQDMIPGIVHAIRDKSLQPLDRQNFLDDQFAQLQSGTETSMKVLTLLEAYIDEDDLGVWNTISYVYDKISRVFSYINMEDGIKHFGKYLCSRALERVKVDSNENDTPQIIQLRSLILSMMVKFGHDGVLSKCKSIYENSIKNGIPIDPNLKAIIYQYVLSKGEEGSIKSFLKLYRDTESTEEKIRLCKALGYVPEAGFLKNILDYSVTEDFRKHDCAFLMISMSKTKAGRDIAWNFFRENITMMKSRYGNSLGCKLIKSVIEDFASEEKYNEVSEFFKINPFPGADRVTQQALESIKVNDMWLKREKPNYASLQEFMESDELV